MNYDNADDFLASTVARIKETIGGQLTQETMASLNADQITLLAWDIVHEEVMDGGFVQLIHNGYGPFIFKNPFAKAVRLWGLRDLSKLIYSAHTLYEKHHVLIEQECSDEEFMALYEKVPEFDDVDDDFVENEEEWTEQIAYYVSQHPDMFQPREMR